MIENFSDTRCGSVGKRCGTCPVSILEKTSPQTAVHLGVLIDRFGLDEINQTLAGERMPTKFGHLVAEAETGLPDLRRSPDIDEEHILVDSMHRITRCRQYSIGE